MEISTFITLGIIAGLLVYAVTIYNHLVTLKHSVSKSWANIDVLLKQRHDELPKLIEVCKQYMGYEKDTMERIIKARSAVASAREKTDIGALGAAETQLTKVSSICNHGSLASKIPLQIVVSSITKR
jgi:LemA protein